MNNCVASSRFSFYNLNDRKGIFPLFFTITVLGYFFIISYLIITFQVVPVPIFHMYTPSCGDCARMRYSSYAECLPAYFPQISNTQRNVIGAHAVRIMRRFSLFMKYYSSQQRQTNLISAVDYSLVEIDIVFMENQ